MGRNFLFVILAFFIFQSCSHINSHNVREIANQESDYSAAQAARQMSFVQLSLKEKGRPDFEIGKYEVTQLEWFLVMGNNPSRFKEEKYCSGDYRKIGSIEMCERHPVETITFDEIIEFLKKMNQVKDGYVYSLPSLSQWDFAARGGLRTKHTYGDDRSSYYNHAVSNIYKNTFSKADKETFAEVVTQTAEVGTKMPNNYGIFDMHGNVWEWTSYEILKTQKFLRGGSWIANSARNDYWYNVDRLRLKPLKGDEFGFRVVRVKN